MFVLYFLHLLARFSLFLWGGEGSCERHAQDKFDTQEATAHLTDNTASLEGQATPEVKVGKA